MNISGTSGPETLTGTSGNDFIKPGLGADVIIGGGGWDYVVGTMAELDGDTIRDLGPGDQIWISGLTQTEFNELSITWFSGGSAVYWVIDNGTYAGGGNGSMTVSYGPVGGFTNGPVGTFTKAYLPAADGEPSYSILGFSRVTHPDNDFNGDGRSDILWRNGSGYLTEWQANANGGFTSNEANAGNGSADSSWQVVATGDFDGDGRADILWRDVTSGYAVTWLGKANGGFTTWRGTGSANTSWHVVGSGDFNGDGRTDILWRNDAGTLAEWLGASDHYTANGGFYANASATTSAADASWQVAGTGDFNGDGISDILWRNAGGYVTEWLGTWTGSFTSNEANAGNGSADLTWQIAGTGDFNGDGMTDILWRNTTSGYVTEWMGTPSGGFSPNAGAGNGSADTSWQVTSIGDFNGDGNSDILWRNAGGYVTEWLGNIYTGVFSSNQAIAGNGSADATWHVQDPFL